MAHLVTEMVNGTLQQHLELDHSAQQVDEAIDRVGRIGNPNLLDNAYWANKDSIINQRGQTEYIATYGGIYSVDRWVISGFGSLLIATDHIAVTCTGQFADFSQRFETDRISGKIVTISVLASGVCTLVLDINSTFPVQQTYSAPGIGLLTLTYQLPVDLTSFRVIFQTGLTANLYAAKLELGPVQTLAHKEGDTWVLNDPPPDPAVELAKCQRYQIENVGGDRMYGAVGLAFGQSGNICYVQVPLLARLRANPTVTYSGVWKLVDYTSLSNWNVGVGVSSMHLERLAGNVATLNVTAESTLDPSRTYALCYASFTEKNSLLFDANL